MGNLPPLSDDEFRLFNRLADTMQSLVRTLTSLPAAAFLELN